MRITKLLRIQLYNYLLKYYNCDINEHNVERVINILTLIVCGLISKKYIEVEMENLQIKRVSNLNKYIKYEHNLKHFSVIY